MVGPAHVNWAWLGGRHSGRCNSNKPAFSTAASTWCCSGCTGWTSGRTSEQGLQQESAFSCYLGGPWGTWIWIPSRLPLSTSCFLEFLWCLSQSQASWLWREFRAESQEGLKVNCGRVAGRVLESPGVGEVPKFPNKVLQHTALTVGDIFRV